MLLNRCLQSLRITCGHGAQTTQVSLTVESSSWVGRWLDDSLLWRLALRILGWSYEYPPWQPWHLFWQIWKRSEQKDIAKKHSKRGIKLSKQLKIRLERSKVIWYGEALTRSRTDGWEVGGLKVVQTSHASDGSSSSSGIPSTCASTTECWDTEINNPRIYCGSMVKDGQRFRWAYVCLCDIVRSRSGIKRADIARLVALSVYGGVRTPGHNLPVWEDLIAFDCKCVHIWPYICTPFCMLWSCFCLSRSFMIFPEMRDFPFL